MSFFQKNKFLIWVIFFALIFRLLILFSTINFPAFNFLDEQTYDKVGWELAQKWKTNGDFNIFKETSHIQVGYYYFVGSIYYIFGRKPIVVSLLNIIISILAAIFLYFLTRKLFSEREAKISLFLAAFWPSIAFWSVQNLKDVLLLFLTAVIGFLFLKIIKKFSFIYFLSFLILSLILLTLRAYTFLILLASLAFGYILISFLKPNKKLIFIGFLIIFLLIFSVIFLSQFKNLEWNFLAKLNLKTLDSIRKSTLFGGSSFGLNIEYKTISDVIKFLPYNLSYSIFAPFPWQFKNGGLFKLAVPETILWYFIFIFMLYGIYLTIKRKKIETLPFLIFIILMSFTFALFQGNIGSLFRQRAQVWFFGFIFASYGLIAFLDSKNLFLKRSFDIIVSIIALILVSPIFLITSLCILLEDGWPIFYLSERVGYQGKKFKMFKFRTMKVNRDNIPEFEYTPENDPRVTKIGEFLRRFSLDEIPQFINILKGEMSLVGPRPAFPFRFLDDPKKYEKRHLVKPGITGWQQVNGRNALDWEKIIELDKYYVDNWSLDLDLKIILKTFSVVLSGKGQYASEALYKDSTKSFKEYIDKSEGKI